MQKKNKLKLDPIQLIKLNFKLKKHCSDIHKTIEDI